MQKILENLQEAERISKKTSHLLYMTYPLVKEKKLLIRIIVELKESITKIINSILQYEKGIQRISIFPDSRSNFETFELKCAERYGIKKQEIEQTLDLFFIVSQHKKSTMEFMKDEKLVILTEDESPITITIEKIKEFQNLSINLLAKTKLKLGPLL